MSGGGWMGLAVCHLTTRPKEESRPQLKKNPDKIIIAGLHAPCHALHLN